jgi:hypothetical protein
VLPEVLKDDLIRHLSEIRSIYDQDRREEINGVWLPGALERKYPNAAKEWGWFWVFPSKSLSIDPRSNIVRRHHVHPALLQKAFKADRRGRVERQKKRLGLSTPKRIVNFFLRSLPGRPRGSVPISCPCISGILPS